MFGSAVSRWTMLHFQAALTFFLVAQLAMLAGVAFPSAPLAAPTTLATVHLLTIGWLTLLMLGALHQFTSVITARGRVAGISALVSLITMIAGLGGMEAGFLALDGLLPPPMVSALPAGGTLVLAGTAIAAASLLRTLVRSRPLPLAARFVAAGLGFLFVALGMGVFLALAFAAPAWVSWSGTFTHGLELHLLAGLIGWFTLTAMGVSYRLLSMFTLAPEERGALGTAAFALSTGGLAASWLLAIASALDPRVPPALLSAAAGLTGFGIALYLFDMGRLYRTRRRRKLELNTGMAIPALAALAVAILFAIYLGVAGATESALGAAGYLFLFGWLSGLGLSQLYKIVPFLTWLERYGSVLGKQAVPRVQDLVDECRDRPWFVLYFAAVATGTVFAALGWPTLWRIAVLGHLIAALMVTRALWLARRGASGRDAQSMPTTSALTTSPTSFAGPLTPGSMKS